MTNFEALFRSKLTAEELADRFYQTLVADGIPRDQAMDAADLAEFKGRAAVVRAMEDWDRVIPTYVPAPVTMIGWYDA